MTDSFGFANLPNQVHRKSVKKGFEFTLLVVGQSGLGKSTLINSLFKIAPEKEKPIQSLRERMNSTVVMKQKTVDIEEKGVKLRLSVVNAQNFGDALDSSKSHEPVLKYIDQQFEKYFNHENGLNRRQVVDSRIHCCFYFISPDGWGLKPMDIIFMQNVHQKVNIIPLIAKSDMLSRPEITEKKRRILQDLKDNGIQIYTIAEDVDEDVDFKNQISRLKSAIPFAISASLDHHDIRGKQVLGRAYPWGIHEVENPDHSDFVHLKSLLVTNMQDLCEVTHDLHYENYRVQRMASGKIHAPIVHETDMDLAGDDISLDSGKDRLLQEKDAELQRMAQKMKEMEEYLRMQQSMTKNGSDENRVRNNGMYD